MFITVEEQTICLPNEDHTYATSSTATTQTEPVDIAVQTRVSIILYGFLMFILNAPSVVSKPVNVKQKCSTPKPTGKCCAGHIIWDFIFCNCSVLSKQMVE